jgi:phosphate acetyltransferase
MPTRHVFDRLIDRCRSRARLPVAVVAPTTQVALDGAIEAAREGLIEPILVGSEPSVRALASRLRIDLGGIRIVDAADDADAAAKGVALCREGQARALMKGSLHTDVLMHAVLDPARGLRGARRVSHTFVIDAPAYPRLLLVTDAAINIYPSLEDKVDIVQNAIDLAHAIGIDTPNVAILSAVETVNPKITSTIDAAALCKMADRGQIAGATLAFDTAVSAEAARIKNLSSPVAGVADVLLVPDLESGNMLAKQLEYLGGAEMAGVVLGARVPIVLTSRADSARARLASCAVARLSAATPAAPAEGRRRLGLVRLRAVGPPAARPQVFGLAAMAASAGVTQAFASHASESFAARSLRSTACTRSSGRRVARPWARA